MKRIITVILAAAILLTLYSCDTAPADTTAISDTIGADTTGAPDTNKETAAADTQPVTEEPETTEKTVFNEMKNIITDFSTPPISRDWATTAFGITNPAIDMVSDGAELDDGTRLTLTNGATCQYLTIGMAQHADKTVQPYLRIWVNNRTSGTLEISYVLTVNGTSAALSSEKACIYTADGIQAQLKTGDASGMGSGTVTSVSIFPGFYGWVSFPTDAIIPYWGQALPDGNNIGFAEELCIDIRSNGFADGEYYIIDELCTSDSPHGEAREYKDVQAAAAEEKINMTVSTYGDLLKSKPEYEVISEFAPTGEFAKIQAITYDSVMRNGKKTKVFAYLSVPEGADEKTPGIVLIHGGGGHPFLQWVKMWADRGYAVIAPDVTGFFPTAVNAGKTETNGDWKYGLHGIFAAEGYTNAPNNDSMSSSSGALENQWMYHAVAQSIIADSILMNLPSTDSTKVGVTGISWGGVITSILIGYDTRLAFAVPVYGSGYLDESLSWMGDNFESEDTRALWSAAHRFDRVDMPVLWLCWNDDSCFSLNSVSKSYETTIGNNADIRISAVNNMMHSHGSAWARKECMAFADSAVKGGEKLPRFTSQPQSGSVECSIEASGKIYATLYYIDTEMTYSHHVKYGYADTFMDQNWKTEKLTVSGGAVTGSLPDDATHYYIELRTSEGLISTSQLIKK